MNWYSVPERLQKLLAVAAEWDGTPFFGNGCIKGRGCSCQTLTARLYIESGLLPDDFAIPEAPMGWGRVHKESLVESFMDTALVIHEKFETVEAHLEAALPGDCLGFKVGGCVHHLGVMLPEKEFIHCLRGPGTVTSRLDNWTWAGRLQRIWRPKYVQ